MKKVSGLTSFFIGVGEGFEFLNKKKQQRCPSELGDKEALMYDWRAIESDAKSVFSKKTGKRMW